MEKNKAFKAKSDLQSNLRKKRPSLQPLGIGRLNLVGDREEPRCGCTIAHFFNFAVYSKLLLS